VPPLSKSSRFDGFHFPRQSWKEEEEMRCYKRDMKKPRSMNEFCQDILRLLADEGIEFLVGGYEVRIIPPEELIWQKAYIMERERFDRADVAHLLLKCGARMDWDHLLDRFGADWRILLSHLLLFGFIYPSRRDLVPRNVMDKLLRRLNLERQSDSPGPEVCNGTLLSRNQYISDIETEGFQDARLRGRSAMTAEQMREWTAAAGAG
jgi:hypothetical protein